MGLIEHKIFHQILLIACLEIVIFSYNSPTKTFPWALDVFHLEAYQFYKIIEILIRTEDGLARDVVKHLQLIEERILERLAWQRTQGAQQKEASASTTRFSCMSVRNTVNKTNTFVNTRQWLMRKGI